MGWKINKLQKKELEYLIHISLKEFNLVDQLNEPYVLNELRKFVKELFTNTFFESKNDIIFDNFDEIFNETITHHIPACPPTYDSLDIARIKKQIRKLQSFPTQKQRSPEWFKVRMDNITASAIHKVMHPEMMDYYREIYEKCNPVIKQLNGAAVMHGVKYEDIALQVYVKRNNVNVLNFGCITHSTIKHVAASPDGICDYSPHNPDYTGRMIEIKCPYSRVINGIVPEHYFYQIQQQLEVCDLEYCDFLECRIEEFESSDTLFEYRETVINHSFDEDDYGVVLEYYTTTDFNESIKYVYSPMGLTEDQLEIWCNNTIDQLEIDHPKFRFSKVSYWILTYYNVILVQRNREFFAKTVPMIEKFWNKVEYYREHIDELEKILKSKKQIVDIELLDDDNDILPVDNTKCMFLDDDDEKPVKKASSKITNSNISNPLKKEVKCMFLD